jgi:hypothetical protein
VKRFGGLLRDTWWLWTALITAGILLGLLVEYIFFIAIPISLFSFIYFGLMRYDENGRPKPDS